MPEIRMRPKHQVTLPGSLVRQANIKLDDKLVVTYANGSIILTPSAARRNQADIMTFAGIATGLWGNTAKGIDQTLSNTKSGWDR
jgi:antitoxin component of MazEF toxin-antitoxin module